MASVAKFDTWQAADGTNVARFNAGQLEVWDGSAWGSPVTVAVTDYLVIAGGGGGGESVGPAAPGAGGGAGGYRCSVPGEDSGGGASAEYTLALQPGTYTVTVGAGGPGDAQSKGTDSVFGTIISDAGGYGGGYNSSFYYAPTSGGSGGGRAVQAPVASGTANQGFAGGDNSDGTGGGAGGGGAGAVGGNGVGTPGGSGGAGVTSSITGSSVGRAGGGGGGGENNIGGTSSDGGGAGGGTTTSAGAGTANTGGGGGGAKNAAGSGGNGGSGVVILRIPNSFTVTKGASHTMSSVVDGAETVYIFTAGDDDITIA